MQDYRSEVGEILAGDPQLVQEIQFDLKRFDEEQRRTIQTPPISVTPHTMMVSDCASLSCYWYRIHNQMLTSSLFQVSPLLSPGVLGPVATTTVMATPPKLKTPAGGQQRTAPRAVGKSMCSPYFCSFSSFLSPSPTFLLSSLLSLLPAS